MNAIEKLSIQELLSKAAYGYDARQVELLANCFAEEAEMSIRIAEGELIGPFKGKNEIMKLMTSSMESQTDKRLHGISNIFIEHESNDAATVLSSLTLSAVENGSIKLLTTGLYRDEVVKQDGNWRIAKRHLDLELPF